MTGGEFFLIAWSLLAFLWWLIALLLLARGPQPKPPAAKTATTAGSISVFKPLPPVESEIERAALAEAIDSFLGQLLPEDEIIVGVDAREAADWESHFACWRRTRPGARINLVIRDAPDQHPNPKVAWLEILAASACGEIWLWSDADVTAPPEFLSLVRAQLSAPGAEAVTAAYTVREISNAPGVLDALYVNLEFLPGALLLDRLGQNEFSYGAACAFCAATFRARMNWSELGAALADDHELGRAMRPVTLLPALVSTFTRPPNWLKAVQHYYRWQKTVRWCRPAGYAAMVVLLPGLGWALGFMGSGGQWFFAVGLLSLWVGEVLVAILACTLLRCHLPFRTWPGLWLWPVSRALTWLAVWLPLPVRWRGHKRTWASPRER
jgi:ceramide glucosyltransferase